MDDVFGPKSFISVITVRKTATPSNLLDSAFFYVIWCAKDAERVKYHALFADRPCDKWARETPGGSWGAEIDGKRRPLTPEEKRNTNLLPKTAEVYCLSKLTSAGAASKEHVFTVDGKSFTPGVGAHWKTTPKGLERLVLANRIELRDRPWFTRFHSDFAVQRVTNLWEDTAGKSTESIYVVQTQPDVIARCVLMTTDPGDLVFDPTCGSGTTAYVAEQWGRRWITCDTSRVALTLAKQRLMTAVFDYYELAHPHEGVGSGFRYKTVPHVTLKSIANNPEIRDGMTREQIDAAIARHAPQETLYDQPFVDRKKTRVSGPFTVEAVPAPAVRAVEELLPSPPAPLPEGEGRTADASIARSGETLRQAEWRDELLRTGIRGKRGQHIRFARLEPLPGCRWLHADGESRPNDEGADRVREGGPAYSAQRIVVAFGPEHAPLEQRQVAQAIEEAQTLVPKPKIIVFATFQFDPEAAKDIDETHWPGVTLLKAQMNADLLTDDLKKKRASNESFWLIGQPDVRIERIATGEDKGKLRVSVHGFDYYNTKTGGVESGGEAQIAVWLLDTDYDGRSLYPRQVFFPMAGAKEGWARLAKNLKAEIDEELIEAYRGTVSLPFKPGEHQRIAVKIVDDRGIESLKVMGLD
jgi:adenine-specific DNA-methyltransferase